MPTLWTKRILTCAFLLLVGFTSLPRCAAEESTQAQPAMSAEQIVATMVSRNEARAAALRGYTGRRLYQCHYRGLPGSKDAEMTVEVRYSAPSTKEFTVVSQSGSKFILDKVLKRLLTSEQEAQSVQNRQETAMTPLNYQFELVNQEVTPHGRFYVLKVEPKRKNKFLYRGAIWVDANDFAIWRIEAEPAKNPSFWISKTHVEQQYTKLGSFWLPMRNKSTSKIRLGGTATLQIDYQDYVLPKDAMGSLHSDAAPGPLAKGL